MKKVNLINAKSVVLILVFLLVSSALVFLVLINKGESKKSNNDYYEQAETKKESEEQAEFKKQDDITIDYFIKKNKYNEYSYIDFSKNDIGALYFQHFRSNYFLDRNYINRSNINVKVEDFKIDINSKIKEMKYSDDLGYIIIIDDKNYKYTFNINYVLNYYLEIEKNE